VGRLARILIVGGGTRALSLAGLLTRQGHAVRITTADPAHRASIELLGAECWVGTPDRLATLRMALENVTVVCWLLAGAAAPPGQLKELHDSRLRSFLGQLIDTTVRGFLYEAGGMVDAQLLQDGAKLVSDHGAKNHLPVVISRIDPADGDRWLAEVSDLIESLLSGQA
jgi:hypothetical protein